MLRHSLGLLAVLLAFSQATHAATEMTCQEARSADFPQRNAGPRYSEQSRRLGEEGRVLLQVQVNALGFPERVEIAQSSGYPRLDDAAQEAVRGWCFIPATKDGVAVTAQLVMPMVFRLEKTTAKPTRAAADQMSAQ
jgi:TonB family protein